MDLRVGHKKAEHQRIDAFKLWWWKRLWRVTWTARTWNQSILKKSNWIFIGRTVAEAETPILWLPDAKSWLNGKKLWCCQRLRIGGEESSRRWDGLMASSTQWTWVWASSGRQWRTEKPWHGSQRVRHDWVTEQPQQPYKLKQNIVFSPAICFFISVTDSTIHIAASYKK